MSVDKALKNLNEVDWRDWQPVWTLSNKKKKKAVTPHDHQEHISPTQPVKPDKPHQPKGPRRRVLDTRLWNTLTPHHQEAAQQIEHACHVISRGLGFRISAPHLLNVSGTSPSDVSDYQTTLSTYYMDWAKSCAQEKISHAACLDILVFGKSCREVDRLRRVRKGWARGNLREGLAAYCRMRGWPDK